MNHRAWIAAVQWGGLVICLGTAEAAGTRTVQRANFTPESRSDTEKSSVSERLDDHERRLGRLEQVAFTSTANAQAARKPASSGSTPSAAKAKTYSVKAGDTLSKIAARTGVSVKKLLAANGLRESSILRPGQTLRLPGGTSAPEPVEKPKSATAAASSPSEAGAASGSGRYGHATTGRPATKHVVKNGDTLYAISRKYGVTEKDLMRANGLTTKSKLKLGASLVIPGTAGRAADDTAVAEAAPRLDPLPEGWHWHEVRQGEGLSQIAAQYGSDRRAIERVNGLQGGTAAVREGMKLKVPPADYAAKDEPTTQSALRRWHDEGDETLLNYTVQKGDTVDALADSFHTTAPIIRRLNKLASTEELSPGRTIVLPNSIFEEAAAR